MVKPKIALITDNPNKAVEYGRFYGRYGIQPLIVSPKEFYGYEREDYNYGAIADRLLVKEGYDQVIREESDLEGPAGEILDKIAHMDIVRQWTRAQVYSISPAGDLTCEKHENFIRGYIDTMAAETGQGFDWDFYFVPERHVDTLSGSAARNLKLSGRELVLTEASMKHLLFNEPVELNFLDAGGKSLVDFQRMPLDVLGNVPWLNTDAFKASPVNRLLGAAVDRGAFFRTSQSRRERNYWMPGLNGGVPLVPKRDDVHELTFMFHDFMHSVMPDILCDGKGDDVDKQIYIAHRMLGEAISLVAADAFFVDTLKQEGCDYDFDKRRIHPLFAPVLDEIRDADEQTKFTAFTNLCYANARYALLGDDSLLASMCGEGPALEAYKEKYEKFFVEDYRWTVRNYDRMSEQSESMALWTSALGNLPSVLGVSTTANYRRAVESWATHNDFGDAESMGYEDIVEAVWETSFNTFFSRGYHDSKGFGIGDTDPHRARTNAVLRYMTGQSFMYTRFAHIPAIRRMGDILTDELTEISHASNQGSGRLLDTAQIERLRRFHNHAVEILEGEKAITLDEARIYRDVVPLFDPYFVFYDAKNGEEEGLSPSDKQNALQRFIDEHIEQPVAGDAQADYQAEGVKP